MMIELILPAVLSIIIQLALMIVLSVLGSLPRRIGAVISDSIESEANFLREIVKLNELIVRERLFSCIIGFACLRIFAAMCHEEIRIPILARIDFGDIFMLLATLICAIEFAISMSKHEERWNWFRFLPILYGLFIGASLSSRLSFTINLTAT
jgi:hypothetical protein